MARVVMEFSYPTTKEKEERLTAVCLVDCGSGATAASVPPGKGGSEGGFALEFLLHHLRNLGYRDLEIHTDGEPAIAALRLSGVHIREPAFAVRSSCGP